MLSDTNQSRQFERTLTVHKIVKESKPISAIINLVQPGLIEATIDLHLTRMVASLNLKWSMSPEQIRVISEDLVDKYPHESLEDFILVFRNARLGEYGELYRLDSVVIFGWMDHYLNHKYEVMEQIRRREHIKDGPVIFPELEPKTIEIVKEFKETFVGPKPVLKLTAEEIKKEGKIRPVIPKAKSAGHKFTSLEEIDLAEKKRLWGLEVHDINTGARKENWIDFPTWLSKQ